MSADGYLEGAPELVAEIAASSASIDLRDKKSVYCRHGVKEYIVWRTYDRALDWFVLENGEYISLDPDSDGIIRSRTFNGLWLNVSALLDGEMQSVMATLQAGLSSAQKI